MKEEFNVSGCGRENDLIAFLYGELDSGETVVFRNHMRECGSCAAELAEFTNIRESVVAWRDEALVGVTSPSVQASSLLRSDSPQPGAFTALREFFKLSPLWLKGAVVFASLLFCLFAVLAAARLRQAPPPQLAINSQTKSYSEQELTAAVERRVREELDRFKNSTKPTTDRQKSVERASNRDSGKRSNRSQELAGHGSQQAARRPLSKTEREQLAADLRLIENPTDGDLDLLDDRINQ